MTARSLPRPLAAATLTAILTLTACGTDNPGPSPAAGAAAGADARYPVEVSNCGRTLRFDQPPKRIVSGWPTSTEILIALGLADRIVGQYNTTSGSPSPAYADAYRAVPVLSPNAPTREALIAAQPDLIWADGEYLFDGRQLPTIKELNGQGVQVMVLSGFCGDDASRATVRDVHTDLATLGTVFGVTAQADKLTADIDGKLTLIADRVAGKPPVPVAIISTFNGTIYTYEGVYSDIARLAGATNIYAATLPKGKYFGELSVEDITKKNPTTLVYLLSGSEDEAKARTYLNRTLPTVTAVRDNRVYFLPQNDSTNLRGIEGVTKLANALHP